MPQARHARDQARGFPAVIWVLFAIPAALVGYAIVVMASGAPDIKSPIDLEEGPL